MQEPEMPADETNRYYHRRAEAELKMARAASVPAAAKAHNELANLYLARVASASS